MLQAGSGYGACGYASAIRSRANVNGSVIEMHLTVMELL